MTPKQEAFCAAYIETGNASEAYRRSYNAENMKPATINVKASELLADGKIAVRLAELRGHHAARHDVTVNDIHQMLLADRAFARECGTAAAAVSATMGLAKLFGHLKDKVEHSGDIAVVDRAELLQRAGDEVRGIFGERAAGHGARFGGAGLPN